MPTSSLLIGSVPGVPAATISVTANAITENVVVPAQHYYYAKPVSPTLSLVESLEVALNGHSELSDVSVFPTQGLRTRMTSSVAFDAVWPDTFVRDLLGFNANLGSSVDHISPDASPLIWAPGKPENSRSRLGSSGVLAKDTQAGRAAPGVVVATTNNTWRENEFTWRNFRVERMQTIPTSNATFEIFWQEVLSNFRRFNLYRNVTEVAASTTPISFGQRLPITGAYIMRATEEIVFPYERTTQTLELLVAARIPVETALEYGS